MNTLELIDQLEDQHIYAVGAKIREILNDLREEEKQYQTLSIAELKTHLKTIPQLLKKKNSIDVFTRIAEIVQSRLVEGFNFDFIQCEKGVRKRLKANVF